MRVAVLLVSGSFLFASAAQAIATDSSIEKKRSVQLTPKWSLPFQGQLASIPAPASTSTTNNMQHPVPSVAVTNDSSKELTLFKQKNYGVLTIAPATAFPDKFIASAGNTGEEIHVSKDGKLVTITGGVSAWDGPFDVDRIVNHLVDTHFENSPEGKKLDEQVKRQNNLAHKTIAITKDSLNNFIEYQGIEPSMRAGRLICESNDYKIRNNAWAEYVRQKYIDQIHFQVVSSLMEIAEGIGNSETERGSKSIAAGK